MRATRETILIPPGHSFRILRWTRSLRDVECLTGGGRASAIVGEGTRWHFHKEMELTFFLSGDGTRFVGDHIAPFGPGDLVFLGEKLPHYWHARGETSGLSIQWHFPESHPFWAFPENLSLGLLFRRAARGLGIAGETARTTIALMQELTRCTAPAQLAALLRIIAQLDGAPSNDLKYLSNRSFSSSAQSHYEAAISRAVQYLVANFRDEVRLGELLRISGLSRPTFARQFKQHAGRSFSEFLNNLRLQVACRDLRESSLGILEIALASGFTQVSFFNRLFRRQLKCNPTDYRLRHRRKR